jgi:hypothetical protein
LVTGNTRDFLRRQPFIRASSGEKLVLLDPSRAEPGGQSSNPSNTGPGHVGDLLAPVRPVVVNFEVRKADHSNIM